jgi:hypothetical protein
VTDPREPSVAPSPAGPSRVARRPFIEPKQLVRLGLLVAGLGGVAWLVVDTGPRRVLDTLLGGAAILPLVMLFDAGYFVSEAFAHRAVLGPGGASIPARVFVRSTLLVYVVGSLVPLGRAGAEVARAAAFTPFVGAGRAAAAGTNVQVAAFVGNTFISVCCASASVAMLGLGSPLTWLLFVNGGGTLMLAIVTWTLVRHTPLGARIAARFPGMAQRFEGIGEGLRATPAELGRAVVFACLARVVQIGQYAGLLLAIGAHLTIGGTLLALGVHLVGAGLGDLVPNQVGVLEGAYRVFADALSLGDDPARAVSIALFARVSQVSIASMAMGVLALWPSQHAGMDDPAAG